MSELELWKEAGLLARRALDFGVKQIKSGVTLLEVCDAVDQWIYENGGKPAWSTQVSLDDVAAHQTAAHNDPIVLDKQVASIDVGVHLNGTVGDNAHTVDLGGAHSDHLKAAKDALDAAIKTVAPGVSVGKIGAVIQEAIESHGLNPVKNLTGHGITPFVIHDKPSVPNFANGGLDELQEGTVIAIEPFATEGVGFVKNQQPNELFEFVAARPTRNLIARNVLSHVKKEYGPFPFAKRWLIRDFGTAKTSVALRELVRNGSFIEHPPLVERSGGKVAVFEHSIWVADKPVVLTKGD